MKIEVDKDKEKKPKKAHHSHQPSKEMLKEVEDSM